MIKYNLTYPQKNIWLMDKFSEGTSINSVAGTIEISNGFDSSLCEKSINNVIKNNDTFRFEVFNENGNIFQTISNYEYQNIEVIDTSLMSDSEKSENVNDWILRPLFLGKNRKLYEFKIFDKKDGSGSIAFKVHHILADAWTCSKVATMMIEYMEKEESEVKPLISYTEYIATEEEYKNSEKYLKDEEFWIEYLKGISEVVSLKEGKKSGSTFAKRYSKKLDTTFNKKINEYCKNNRISPYTLFLTAIYTYIYRILGKNDIILGTPVLNRTNFKEKQIFGMFVSTLPIRMKIIENEKFIELAKRVSLDTMSIFRHQRYPYSKTLEYVYDNTNIKDNLYNIMVSYQNARSDMVNEEKYSTTWLFNQNINDELQVHITDFDNTGTLSINYDYKVELFSDTEIELIHTRILAIIESAIENLDKTIEEISVMSKEEEKQLLYEFNDTKKEYRKGVSVIELFEEQVKKYPENVALVVDSKRLSYNELNKKANKLANYLMNVKNVKPNDIVALIMKRDEQLIISLLAILKCGATYIPIDYKFPESRISNMLGDAKLVLINDGLSFNLDDKIDLINVKNIENELIGLSDENIKISNTLNYDKKLDYIIFTSGSTGKPKGVMITSQNLVNFVFGINEYLNISDKSKLVSITTISFDIFGLEIWSTLSNGATMILANDIECLNQSKLNSLCVREKANIIQTTPTKLKMLLTQTNETEFIKNMDKVLLGGEAIPDRFVEELREITSSTILNLYGPSETTIWSTVNDITKGRITAGRPIQNTKLYIVDFKNRLLPKFCEGELCIGGDSVSVGYFNRADLTEKSFVRLQYTDGIVYKTGDLASIDDKGELSILGRMDFQVKVNGQRVELEEIEKFILKNSSVKNAVVVLNKDKKLVCFYTLNNNKNLDEDLLKESLLRELPIYMIPNVYVKLDEFPNTLNNKIDRKALINMNIKMESKINTFAKPETHTESVIYDAWKKVLKERNFGIDDNFFELGADSLDAINVQIELMSKNIHIEYSDLSKYQTIRKLAKKVNIKNKEAEYKVESFDKDYSMILEKNNSVYIPQKYEVKNVILSGVTGFLGSHILAEIINRTNSVVFCFIRGKNGQDANERLRNTLHYFFDEKYDNFIGTRIIPIDADITSFDNFNISESDLKVLKNSNVNFFVHSAACVKHYGKITNFSDINIGGTHAVAKYCYENDINLMHISTLSVSGNAFETMHTKSADEDQIFNESSFYQNQNLNNVYVYTKFRAEEIVLDYMKKGLKANIIRIGNLTSRFYKPKFQPNVEENAFAGRIKTFIELGYIPKLDSMYLEFTPIDLTSVAIIKIMEHFNLENTIFHLFNHNHITIKRLLKILKEIEIKIDLISIDDFSKRLNSILNSDKKYIIKGIINDLDENGKLDYSTNVKIKSDITRKYLQNIGYEWKRITDNYVIGYLKCLKESGFIDF